MKALVIGATGATGLELIQHLINDKAYTEIVAFVRKPYDFGSPKVTTEVINFDKPKDWEHLVNGNVAFSCLGTTLKDAGSKDAQWKIDYDYQLKFAKTSKANNIDVFILVSAAGATAKSNIFYQRMKGELEVEIKNLNFPKLIILKPGLLERPKTNRLGEKLILPIIKNLNKLGILNSQKPLPTTTLAKAMVNIAKLKNIESKEISGIEIFNYADI